MNSKKSAPIPQEDGSMKADHFSIYIQNASIDELDKLIESMAVEVCTRGIDKDLLRAICAEKARRGMIEDLCADIANMAQELDAFSEKVSVLAQSLRDMRAVAIGISSKRRAS